MFSIGHVNACNRVGQACTEGRHSSLIAAICMSFSVGKK